MKVSVSPHLVHFLLICLSWKYVNWRHKPSSHFPLVVLPSTPHQYKLPQISGYLISQLHSVTSPSVNPLPRSLYSLPGLCLLQELSGYLVSQILMSQKERMERVTHPIHLLLLLFALLSSLSFPESFFIFTSCVLRINEMITFPSCQASLPLRSFYTHSLSLSQLLGNASLHSCISSLLGCVTCRLRK